MWYKKDRISQARVPLHVVGDIHGKYELLPSILSLIPENEVVYQLGDFGFEPEQGLRGISPNRLRIIAGNHEHYPRLMQLPHYMGDYGVISHPNAKVFFARGAESIDRSMRIHGRDWFPEEEFDYRTSGEFLDAWNRERPDVMLSHTTPISATRELVRMYSPKGYGSHTDRLFEEALKIHRPRIWAHGHHHVGRDYDLNGTHYISLGEGEHRSILL